jgi:DNA-directed RNA polymerase subunit E'/Rpb7
MGNWRSYTAATLGVLAAWLDPVAAEDNQLIATVEQPAVVTAPAVAPGLGLADQRVVISVMVFVPPRDGAVQGVVTVQITEGGTQEIGTFGIFPNAEFRAADPRQARRFSFPLPKELARGGPVRLEVQIAPIRGDGKGARLELGGAEIR